MPATALADFLLLAALWGSSFLFTRFAVSEFGPMATAFGRCAIAAAVLVPLVLARGLGPQLRQCWKRAAVIGVLNSGIPFALFAFAVQSITTGMTSIVNATVPMFGALVAWFWLEERPNASRLLGLAVGFAGVALLVADKGSFAVPGAPGSAGMAVLAGLLACLFYGIAGSAAKVYLQGLPPLVTSAGSQIGASLFLLVPTLWVAPGRWPSAGAWLALTALGVLCTGTAYFLYFRIVERVGPARALAVPFLMPVFAVFYGVLFLDEPVSRWMLTCGAVIVLGTALATGVIGLPRRKAPAR